MILFVNCCPRKNSRTLKIAKALLGALKEEYEEVNLYEEELFPLDEETLNKRTSLIKENDFSDEIFAYANQFASANTIVIAAPYWDLSFPSMLKTYVENIYVTGIVSKYSENGFPEGLCKAEKLFYVTTAGGPYNPEFSYQYLSDLATKYFGIKKTQLICAENLDVVGYSADEIVNATIKKITNE